LFIHFRHNISHNSTVRLYSAAHSDDYIKEILNIYNTIATKMTALTYFLDTVGVKFISRDEFGLAVGFQLSVLSERC